MLVTLESFYKTTFETDLRSAGTVETTFEDLLDLFRRDQMGLRALFLQEGELLQVLTENTRDDILFPTPEAARDFARVLQGVHFFDLTSAVR